MMIHFLNNMTFIGLSLHVLEIYLKSIRNKKRATHVEENKRKKLFSMIHSQRMHTIENNPRK